MNPSIVLRNATRAATRRPAITSAPRQRLAALRVAGQRSASTKAAATTTAINENVKKAVKYTADS
jgi:hypothetical protein